MARVLQIMEVTGKGLVNDKFVQAFHSLSAEAEAEIKETFKVAHTGNLMEFAPLDVVTEMARKAKETGNLPESELNNIPTSWNGNPLEVGTRYGVNLGEEAESASIAGVLGKQLNAQFSKERFVKAEGEKAFQAGSAADARKNVGQSAKPAGGAWGQKRQGPPRV